MASLLSWKFFEGCNACYYSKKIIHRELFTYVVIITLIILVISQLILWIVCISFDTISVYFTSLKVTLRRGGSYPIISADTRTVGIFPSVLFVYLIIK